jgi:primosomal protein N' (replication factor Y)
MKVDVAIPRTKLDFFTYVTDEALNVGDLVSVPLRNKSKYGIVVKTNSQREIDRLKKVASLVHKKFLPLTLIKLYKWMSDYYIAPLGEVLRLALPAKILKTSTRDQKPKTTYEFVETPVPTYAQSTAVKSIMGSLNKGSFETFLLYGITGSGKTEVYLRCAENIIKTGGRVLALVPEISMTPLLFTRFQERFKDDVITIHSSMTIKERRDIWYAIRNGEYKVIIGPRSTIFVPIPDLKMIIVDEEHDRSYKEHERMPRYNARDVAVMRGRFENITVVLGSATPQIESYHNAGIGKYKLLTLKERIDNRSLPSIEMIDLRKKSKKFITPELESAIEKTLEKDEQIILFLNRRGFAPSLLCPNCGYIAKCPYCKLPLVYHKAEKDDKGSLSCHICQYKAQIQHICPKCARTTLLYRGAGTQRIEELLGKIFRDTNKKGQILRLDRDTARKKGQAEKIYNDFENRKAKILLGTQLVTKGFDFPDVTLVGILNADVVLNLPDFRSSEQTFQMLTQVAGRSGRGKKPGSVIMQTYRPEQYSVLFSQLQDYPKFYALEMKLRKELNFPPFSKLILLRVRGEKEKIVHEQTKKLYDILKRMKNIEVLGPNRSFYYKIRKNYRVFIILRVSKNFKNTALRFLKTYKIQNCILEVDVDPLEVF